VSAVRGLLWVVLSMALLAAMFAAVHRGARGRELAARIEALEAERQALEAQRTELVRRIEALGGRARVMREAARLGLRLPAEGELVILEIGSSGGGDR
jgi:cell division protein FtsB